MSDEEKIAYAYALSWRPSAPRSEIIALGKHILAAIKKAKAQEIGFISPKDGLKISIPNPVTS